MEPIISPWLIYFVGLVNPLGSACAISGIIVLLMSIAALVGNADETVKPSDREFFGKWGNRLLPVSLILCLLAIFVPDKQTVLQMIAASYITPDNLAIAADGVVSIKNEVKDDILDIIHTVSNATGQ
jgi:hypothetical protein